MNLRFEKTFSKKIDNFWKIRPTEYYKVVEKYEW